MASRREKRQLKRKIKTYLLEHSSPRWQALLICLFVGLNAVGASALLAWSGIRSMPLRYFLVITYAYGLFFIALHWLVKYHLYRERFNEDLREEVENHLESEADGEQAVSDLSDSDVDVSSVWDSFSFDFDLDELAVLILPVLLVASAVAFSFYFVYIAPVFIAEILVDAVAMVYVFRKVKNAQSQHWSGSVLNRTLGVYVVVLILFCAGGWFIQHIWPDVVTIGDVYRE